MESGLHAAPPAMFRRFIFFSTSATAIVSMALGTIVAAVREPGGPLGMGVAISVFLIMSVFALALAILVATIVASLTYPFWSWFLARVVHISPRLALAVGAAIMAMIAGGVLALITGLDADVVFGATADIGAFVVVGMICGTLIAWRVYAEWL